MKKEETKKPVKPATTLDSGGGSNTNPPEPGQPPKKPK